MKKFRNFYKESKDNIKVLFTVNRQLKSHKLKIEAIKLKNGKFYVKIKSLKDPNLKGLIEYESEEDVILAAQNIKTHQEIINYLTRNSKSLSGISFSEIIRDEKEFEEKTKTKNLSSNDDPPNEEAKPSTKDKK